MSREKTTSETHVSFSRVRGSRASAKINLQTLWNRTLIVIKHPYLRLCRYLYSIKFRELLSGPSRGIKGRQWSNRLVMKKRWKPVDKIKIMKEESHTKWKLEPSSPLPGALVFLQGLEGLLHRWVVAVSFYFVKTSRHQPWPMSGQEAGSWGLWHGVRETCGGGGTDKVPRLSLDWVLADVDL